MSYTEFQYSNLEISPKENKVDFDRIQIACKIKNIGEHEGDEVVQLYIRDDFSSVVTYEKLLRGFERIHLSPGEERTILFTLYPEDLMLLNRKMKRVIEAGSFSVYIGSSSEDTRLEGKLELKN